MKHIWKFVYLIVCVATAMVGYNIHHSFGWAIVDFFFAPVAWAKWLVYHQVNLTIIRHTFDFFLR